MDLSRSIVTVRLFYKYGGIHTTNTENTEEKAERKRLFKDAWVLNKLKAETAHGVTADVSHGNIGQQV